MDVNGFSYRYSKSESEEMKELRDKYVPREKTNLEKIREIDQAVTRDSGILAYTIGIVSALILGLGMCMTMVWQSLFIPGICIGLIGIVGVAITYPLYRSKVGKLRRANSEKVRQLSAEANG